MKQIFEVRFVIVNTGLMAYNIIDVYHIRKLLINPYRRVKNISIYLWSNTVSKYCLKRINVCGKSQEC